MNLSGCKGNILLFVVVAMTTLSVLGTGIYFMTTSSTFSGIDTNDQHSAYQLAIAGRDYALAKNLGATTGRYFTMSDGRKFYLVISGDVITSTGIVKEGTPQEARRTITITKPGFSTQAGITLAESITAMRVTQPTSAPSDFISKTGTAVALGNIGAPYERQFGTLVYTGNAVQGSCVSGKCAFGRGFNAFFVFQFASGSTGDGFTFTFFNGSHNSVTSTGGYAGQGELMGYAGSSYVSPGYYLDGAGGKGIQPPKVALEFDPYQNTTAAVCSSDSRYDAPRNHAAFMFWGDVTTSCGSLMGTAEGKLSFDDNRHGTGTNSPGDPINAMNFTSHPSTWDACSYFNGNNQCGTSDTLGWPTHWLLNAPNNVYAVRLEVTRSLTAVGGNYSYQIKTWIKPCASGDLTCAAFSDASNLANLKTNYVDTAPTLNRTFVLSEALHLAFNTTLFGWTTATGNATQKVNITRFGINFLN